MAEQQEQGRIEFIARQTRRAAAFMIAAHLPTAAGKKARWKIRLLLGKRAAPIIAQTLGDPILAAMLTEDLAAAEATNRRPNEEKEPENPFEHGLRRMAGWE